MPTLPSNLINSNMPGIFNFPFSRSTKSSPTRGDGRRNIVLSNSTKFDFGIFRLSNQMPKSAGSNSKRFDVRFTNDKCRNSCREFVRNFGFTPLNAICKISMPGSLVLAALANDARSVCKGSVGDADGRKSDATFASVC